MALPGSAKLSRSYPGVDSKGTYRNGERLYQHAHGVHTQNFFYLQCTRRSTCGWRRMHTISGGTQCIRHGCGFFGHGSMRNMRPAHSVAFLVCSMSAAVIRTLHVAFRRMFGSVASERGWCVQTPGNVDLVKGVDCILSLSPAMALHGTTKAHSVRRFEQTLATHRPGEDGSRTARESCQRPHHRCRRGHHRGGRTHPTPPPCALPCATARDQHSRGAVGRRTDETTSPTHPPARACGCPRRRLYSSSRAIWHGPRGHRARVDAAAALTAALPVAVPPYSSLSPLSDGKRALPPI